MPYKDKEQRKEYQKAYHKGWYQRNKEKVIEKRKKRQLDIYNWYRKYKSTLCCIECGEKHPACLNFHHKSKGEKSFSLGDVASRATSIKALLNEISKCEVLCINCHARRHWHDMHEFDTSSQVLESKLEDDEAI